MIYESHQGGKRSEQNGRIYRFGRHGKQYGIAHFRSGLSCFSLHADETKAEEILNKGAVWQETVKDLSEKADIIITMVGYPSDVEEIYLGENGILRHAKEGAFVIDMTTSKPSLAKKIAEKAKEKSIHALDAPVSGGDIGARNGTLAIMAGGEKSV